MNDAAKTIRQPKAESKEAKLRAMREQRGKRKTSVPVKLRDLEMSVNQAAVAVATTTTDDPPVATKEKKMNTTRRKSTSKKTAARNSARVESKSDAVHRMLTSTNGATREQLSKATGWPNVNLNVAASRAKMKLVENEGRFKLVAKS